MFFLCFSGQDRATIVQSVLYHLQKYGLDVWYDNYKYILGDQKYNTYSDAIKNSQYAVVIFSPSFSKSLGALEELEVIKKRYYQGNIHIFPIFYNISANLIPAQYSWLCEMIYNELDDSTGTLLTCNQMANKFLSDILSNKQYRSLWEMKTLQNILPEYVLKMIEDYFNIIPENINSRLTLLYCLFLYLDEIVELPQYLPKSANYIFQTTRLNLSYNFKEIIIMEQIVCLAINQYITSNLSKFEE